MEAKQTGYVLWKPVYVIEATWNRLDNYMYVQGLWKPNNGIEAAHVYNLT